MQYKKYFNRFEIKYQISLRERDRIINYIRPFTIFDPYIQNNYAYEVRSIYYDSHFRHSLLEKIDGVGIRKKLRIRYYPDIKMNKQKLVFIEIKKKINDNVSKSRILVPLEKASAILYSNTPESIDFYKNASIQDKNTLKEIWFLMKKNNLKPVCLVSYKRQPYLAKINKNFRVTFDTNVLIRDYNLDLNFGGGLSGKIGKLIVPRGICIMEVKFNNFIPNWAIHILQKNDCLQYKISKFASGLEKTKACLSVI